MKRAIQFIVLVCAVSWIIAGIAIFGFGLSRERQLFYMIFAMCYMLLPTMSAIILQVLHKEKPFKNLNVSFRLNRWFIIASLVPIFYSFLTLGINLLFPNISFTLNFEGVLSSLPPEQAEIAREQLLKFPPFLFLVISLIQSIVAAYTINAFFAFGEEFGWRAYLLGMLKDYKFLSASLIIGVVWGLWHFPLILLGHNYPQHPQAGVGMMVVWCILLSPAILYITLKSGSVITAAIFHGALNASAGFSLLYIKGGNDIINGVPGIAGFIGILLVNSALFLFDKYVTKENIFGKTVGEFFNLAK